MNGFMSVPFMTELSARLRWYRSSTSAGNAFMLKVTGGEEEPPGCVPVIAAVGGFPGGETATGGGRN